MVTGRVQGVFFRNAAKKVADQYELVGRAKNLKSGEVEIVVQGEEVPLRRFLDWCYRGSFLAKVEALSFKWEEPVQNLVSFSVERQGSNIIEDKLLALKSLSKKVFNEPVKVPGHVVVIPDGNRRWARENNLAVWRGHQKGIDRVVDLLRQMKKAGVKFLTVWGFSTENWDREKQEIDKLMEIFGTALKKFGKEAVEQKIGFHHFGRTDRLPKGLIAGLERLKEDTHGFNDFHFAIALDYGGRDEMLRAIQKLQSAPGEISEKKMSDALDTNGFPDPDLIIRTSGEQRLSGIMPWQSVNAELYFVPVHFPDFDIVQFQYALQEYSYRERRFGH